jgi:pimeloyl-ACP methyl ester carboxylesterase
MKAGSYLDVNGVHTYYEVHGAGEPLVLLHGGLCLIETFAQQTPILAKHFRVFLPERRGHGRTPDTEGQITFQLMADDTVAFMHALGLEEAHLIGHSDGATVGYLVAMQHPELVRKLVSIGGNFHAIGLYPQPHIPRPDVVRGAIAELKAMYERLSPDGPDHYPIVLAKLERMWAEEPTLTTTELASIRAPTLVVVGDGDVIRPEHTLELFRAVPAAQLCVVPDSSHFVMNEKPKFVNRAILDFLLG